jgi:uncharacterized protein
MHINKLRLFRWLKVFILIYCSIGIALYYLQEKFLFHPVTLDTSYNYSFKKPFEELMIPVNKEDTISLVKFFPADSTRRGIVVYYHGNMENINHYEKFSTLFTKHGYEVWMADYPGFGKGRGERTEKKMYDQALQVHKMAAGKVSSDSIIIYGKSLGTGIAAYVASVTRSKRLILETPYFSIPDLFNSFSLIYPTSYMSTYKIPTWKYLGDVDEPVTILHGTKDLVTFYSRAKKLKKYLKPGDEFITIEGGKHNDLVSFEIFNSKIDSLLR